MSAKFSFEVDVSGVSNSSVHIFQIRTPTTSTWMPYPPLDFAFESEARPECGGL